MIKTYVVQDYDCVEYAGTKLADAKKKLKGSNTIQIWVNGLIIGFIGYKNNVWYTHYYVVSSPM